MDSLILFGDERMLNLGRVASSGSAQSFGEMQGLPVACGMLSATHESMGLGGRGQVEWTVGGKSRALSQCAAWVFTGEARARFGCE